MNLPYFTELHLPYRPRLHPMDVSAHVLSQAPRETALWTKTDIIISFDVQEDRKSRHKSRVCIIRHVWRQQSTLHW